MLHVLDGFHVQDLCWARKRHIYQLVILNIFLFLFMERFSKTIEFQVVIVSMLSMPDGRLFYGVPVSR